MCRNCSRLLKYIRAQSKAPRPPGGRLHAGRSADTSMNSTREVRWCHVFAGGAGERGHSCAGTPANPRATPVRSQPKAKLPRLTRGRRVLRARVLAPPRPGEPQSGIPVGKTVPFSHANLAGRRAKSLPRRPRPGLGPRRGPASRAGSCVGGPEAGPPRGLHAGAPSPPSSSEARAQGSEAEASAAARGTAPPPGSGRWLLEATPPTSLPAPPGTHGTGWKSTLYR